MPRFRLPLNVETAYKMILGFYIAEVEFRHREFIEDSQTDAAIKRLACLLTAENLKFGILLCGDCGNGKTTYLYALQNLINWLRNNNMFDSKDEQSIGMIILSSRELAYYSQSDFPTFLKYCKTDKILAIDDLGEEPTEILNYGNIQNPLIELIEYRYANQFPTFLTSNLDPEEISVKYGDRIADRLKEMVETIPFRKKMEQSYRNEKII